MKPTVVTAAACVPSSLTVMVPWCLNCFKMESKAIRVLQSTPRVTGRVVSAHLRRSRKTTCKVTMTRKLPRHLSGRWSCLEAVSCKQYLPNVVSVSGLPARQWPRAPSPLPGHTAGGYGPDLHHRAGVVPCRVSSMGVLCSACRWCGASLCLGVLFYRLDCAPLSLMSAGGELAPRLLPEVNHLPTQRQGDPVPGAMKSGRVAGPRAGANSGTGAEGGQGEITRSMVILWSEIPTMLLLLLNSAVTPIDFRASTRL